MVFGWLWITLGLISGTLMGLYFHRDDWLGGYDSWRRRLIRLGHIATIALGAMNVLFSLAAPHASLKGWELALTSWSFVVGAVAMPLVCGLAAWHKPMRHLFFIPVASLLCAAITLSTALLRSGVPT